LLETIGVHYKPGKFEGLWIKASTYEAVNPEDRYMRNTISVNSLLRAMRDLHYVE
jgi:hypothetical protein